MGLGDVAGAPVPSHNIPLLQFTALVREYLRDHPVLNRLTVGQEHSDRMIQWAIADALMDWNGSPPFTSHRLENFPRPDLLKIAAVISLLESLGFLQTRNQLTYSDGGIQVGVSDKTPLIQSWIQLLTNKYEQKKQQYKIAENIENGWGGGVSSEYLSINGYYGGW